MPDSGAVVVTESGWHARSADDTAEALQTDRVRGLSTADAATRLIHYGLNTLAAARPVSALSLIVHQFRSLIVVLLFAAGAIALLLGDVIEALAILVVIVLNAVIGFVTEWKAASALAGLRRQSVAVARVVRDSRQSQIPAEQLVPGDVVLLDVGDRVPADGRLIEHARLHVDEAALTGESLPVAKSTDPVTDLEAALGDRISMVHMGTAVNDGRGRFIVTATAAQTEMGRIGTLIAAVGDTRTPLEAKLAQLSRALLVIVLLLCALIVGIGWLRGNALLSMVEVGISLAIAAVPEGLLAVTTMTLAVGMQRMAGMNALIRRLPAVESLGSTTVICTDKTGTLTRNEMTIRAFDVAGQRVEVAGSGYAVSGEFRIAGQKVEITQALELALRIGALCNDAKLDRSGNVANVVPTVLGDPTEAALIVAFEKAGLDRPDLALASLRQDWPRLREIPFSSESRRMVTVHRGPDGKTLAYVKGSPARCSTPACRCWSAKASCRFRPNCGCACWLQTMNWPAPHCACSAWGIANCRSTTATTT